MSEDFQSQVPATPVHDGGRVPPGCLVSNRRWNGSQFHKAARAQIQVIFEDDLGVADFYPTSEMAVVYISESDLVAGTAYRRKLAKLRKVEKLKGVVVVEKTPMTDQYYLDLQKFVVLELGMVILPISNQTEAAGLLARMVLDEQKPHPNPFLIRRKTQSIDSSLLVTMQAIPKLGAVKAKRLLQKFGSIKNITEASVEELASVIGTANARHVKNFLTTKVTLKR